MPKQNSTEFWRLDGGYYAVLVDDGVAIEAAGPVSERVADATAQADWFRSGVMPPNASEGLAQGLNERRSEVEVTH